MFYCIFNHVVSCCSHPLHLSMIPSQRQMWQRVIFMSLLLIVICGIFLWQPTVNVGLNSLSLLCSGRSGRWWWLLVWKFWQKQELSATKKDKWTLQKGWCAYKDSIMQYCRNYFTILQENDGAGSRQCSKETVSFLRDVSQKKIREMWEFFPNRGPPPPPPCLGMTCLWEKNGLFCISGP